MTDHVMIDLETLGTNPDCVVVTIGAVRFNPVRAQLPDAQFYSLDLTLPIDPQIAAGRTITGDTFAWWLSQSPDAQGALVEHLNRPVQDIEDALREFRKFFNPGDKVWGNGATFDISILESLIRTYDQRIPWKFWNIRDTRTVWDMASVKGWVKTERKGIFHNAVDDARQQADWVISAYKHLGLCV